MIRLSLTQSQAYAQTKCVFHLLKKSEFYRELGREYEVLSVSDTHAPILGTSYTRPPGAHHPMHSSPHLDTHLLAKHLPRSSAKHLDTYFLCSRRCVACPLNLRFRAILTISRSGAVKPCSLHPPCAHGTPAPRSSEPQHCESAAGPTCYMFSYRDR